MSDTILIVDDEYHFTDSLKRILHNEGFDVDSAVSGREAFTRIKARRYSAVLLDLHLPDLDGIEVAEYLTGSDPDCAVIILTGQATVDSAMQAVRFGCYDYITKPCRPERVVRTLKRATENRQLKKELVAGKEKYQRLAEATWEGIVVFSHERICEVNTQFCDLFGTTEDKVIGQPLDEFIPGLVLPAPILPTSSDTRPPAFEIEAIRKNGAVFPAEIRVKCIMANGSSRWVAAIRDLTRRRQEEQSRTKLEEKLTYAMRMESIGLMAGSVAHDLNNILTSIVTFPELLLLDMPANAKYRVDIDRIKRAGQQAAAVVADLLTITRGSSCKKEIRNINDMVREYRDSLDYIHQSRSFPDVRIEFDLDPSLGNTRVTPIQVTKSLINLVRNGAEAIGEHGTIRVYTTRRTFAEPFQGYEAIPPGQYEVLSVADTGKGIAAKHLAHIFEPFYSQKQMGNSGTGLGLTIIMHTMRDHAGFIDLRSGPDGTLFELFFPTCSRREDWQSSTMSLDLFLGKGEKVLVIDDMESQRIITSSILKRLGYTPYSVASGEQAIQHVKQEHVDLLLLDMIMDPGKNGYETFKEIRRIVPDQRAVVTTGCPNHPDRERIRALGVSHYLAKPLSVTHLAQAIRQEINH
jgi:PAS domain S-box-containing protein